RSLLVEDQRLTFDARQAANARADRAAGTQLRRLVHIGQAGVLDRLSGSIQAIDDERIDLALDFVIDPLAGVEAILVIGRLYLASDPTLLIRSVELGDRSGTAFRSKDIGPACLD